MGLAFATDRVAQLLQTVLGAIVDAADGLGIDLPERQITANGGVPFDCEQVAVYVTQLNTGAPESIARSGSGTYPNPGANVTLYTAVVMATIVRTTHDNPGGPQGQIPPSPDAYSENLDAASADAAVLLVAAAALQEGWTVAAVPPAITFPSPAGGMVAVTARLAVLV